MIRTIWKYAVEVGYFKVMMPAKARVLAVNKQNDQVVMWALCNPDNPKVSRTFCTVGTGHDASLVADWIYIGTVQFERPGLVWHLFEEP